jgi:hypothetical protein
MKNRPLEYARPVKKYALASVVAASFFTLSFAAAAQPDEGPPSSDATEKLSGAGQGGTATPIADEGAKTDEDKKPAKTEPKEPAPAKAKPKAEVAASKPGNAEAEATPPPLTLERLPATAYPDDPIPGIANGSLTFVRDRMQWPYMPKYAGPPQTRIGFSGISWVDSSLRSVKAGAPTEKNQTEYRMQGRLTLRVTPVYNISGNWFVQSNTEFVGNVDQDHSPSDYTEIDDAWIRVGKWKIFDIQVGRMQGFEVYHFGMGLDLNTFERKGAVTQGTSSYVVQPYGLTDLWDRGLSNGAVAIHSYYPKWLRLELLARFGISGKGNDLGLRPVGVLDLGWAKLKGGYEIRSQPSIYAGNQARVNTKGGAGELQFVFNPWVEFGGGYGHRVVDTFDENNSPTAAASHTTDTYGGFLNVRPYLQDTMIGVGYHYTTWEDFNFDAFGRPESRNHTQMFAAAQYTLWHTLYIKYVIAYSKAHIYNQNNSNPNDTGFDNQSISHRVRLMMLF